MLLSCYELLKKRKDILSAWQKKFHYILVDEFQDINHLQYDIVKMLAAPENNLFVVGDDDQSIYHFRGARPEIMLNFPEDFKNAETVILNINYRCSGNILDTAMKVINYNENRYAKKLSTPNEPGEPVQIKEFEIPETNIWQLQACCGIGWKKGIILKIQRCFSGLIRKPKDWSLR